MLLHALFDRPTDVGVELNWHNSDGHLQLFLSRAAMLKDDRGTFDPVWVPPGK